MTASFPLFSPYLAHPASFRPLFALPRSLCLIPPVFALLRLISPHSALAYSFHLSLPHCASLLSLMAYIETNGTIVYIPISRPLSSLPILFREQDGFTSRSRY
ncbi:putative inositol oxygenase [Fusarium oxysporum f. sp. albedinis]|nr:hypothetical protein HZ326_26643 [Fusarium oxysporum f. sp. albedinis]KAJ0140626.1 putative inositol oxygenase [Fusarium oxysporum f. sp. albedinis]